MGRERKGMVGSRRGGDWLIMLDIENKYRNFFSYILKTFF